MKLFNTASRKIEEFRPLNPDKVKIYTCGPTVYSSPHIGNFSAYIYWDLLIRTIIANGYKPYRVLNLTDVGHLTSDGDTGEDKLEKGAKKEGKTVWEIADFYIKTFKDDYKKLSLIEPDVWARATDYIEESEDLVNSLIKNGFTYETTDGIYFDTSKFNDYATFAHLDIKNLKAGARVSLSEEKKHHTDFAVWKYIKPGEDHAMRWDFQGHPGYPGWHLECSTIIHAELGEPIDIHTGGIDHIPVHHTNEIAQTFGAYGQPLAKHWLHCNFLTINGKKISKSIGNIITIDELNEKGFSPFDFKLWLYQGHYRVERNFTWEDLSSAKNRRLKWKNACVKALQQNTVESGSNEFSKTFKNDLLECLNNDLNSSISFAHIDENLEKLSAKDWADTIESLFALNVADEANFEEYKKINDKLQPIIKERELSRKNKDYAKADEIRNTLSKENLTILDTPAGPIWQFIS